KVIADVRIELNAGVDKISQPDASFKNDKRSGFFGSKRRCGEHDLVIYRPSELSASTADERYAKPVRKEHQRLADLRLKKDNDRKTDVNHGVAKHEFERRQVLRSGDPIKQAEKQKSDDR